MVLKCVMFLYCLAVANAEVVETSYAPTPAVSTSPVVTKTVTPGSSKTVITPGAPVYETIVTTHESNHKSSDGSSYFKTLDTSYSQTNKFESRPLSQVYGIPSLRPVSSYGETTLVGAKIFPIIKTVSPPFVYPGHGPVQTNTVYHQDFSFDQISPLNKSVFPIVTKSISPPVVVTPSVLTKTVSPILKKTVVTPVLTAQATPHNTVTPVLTKTISPIVYNPHVVTNTFTPVFYNPHVVPKTISPVVYNPHVVTKTITPVLKKVISPAAAIQTAPVKTVTAYSDAAVVSHMSFNGLGASYAW